MYSGMFYITGTHYSYMDDEALKWFFFMLIVIPNALFILFWLYHMRIELLKLVHARNNPALFRIVSCYLHTYESFKKAYMNDANTP